MPTLSSRFSMEMLEAVLLSAVGAVLVIDTNGLIQITNPATEQLFGYSHDELFGQNVKILMTEEHQNNHDGYITHHLETGEKKIIGIGREVEGRHKSGRIFPLHLAVSAFVVDDKKYFAGIIHDLSQRTRLQAEIDRQSLLFQAVFDHVPETLIISDADRKLILINPAGLRTFRYERQEIAGKSEEIFFEDPDEFKRVGDALAAPETKGRYATSPISARFRRKNGEVFPGQIISAVIRSSNGRPSGFVGLVRDLTEELKLEEARVKSQRLEAIGQLTGGVAHDFNNLLTIISGNLELLMETTVGKDGHDILRRASQAADAGARLTSRLLTFARRRQLEPQVINLNDQVNGMLELLHRTLGEEVELSTNLAPDLWPALIDPSEIENAIVNLSLNARDAMHSGGKLLIETSNTTLEAGQMPKPMLPGAFVRLAVSDNGIGMSADTLARAFEPFFTTKPPGKGTGLGLSTIYGFVKQSGGNVAIYSELGTGTTVSVYLPRHVTGGVSLTPARKDLAPRPASGQRVLVVEDNTEVREIAVKRLERLGYKVVESPTASAAIADLSSGLDVDVVFSDVVMPGGLSGFDLASWLRKNRPRIAVVLASGFASDMIGNGDPVAHEIRILRKPYTQAEVANALAEALARGEKQR